MEAGSTFPKITDEITTRGKRETLEMLRTLGLPTHRDTVSAILRGKYSARETQREFEASTLLTTGNNTAKLALYRRVVDILLDQRETYSQYPQRYISSHYTERVAETLGIQNPQIVRLMCRCMRADLISCLQEGKLPNLESKVNTIFLDTLSILMNPPSLEPSYYDELRDEFIRHRMLGVYEMTGDFSRRAIGTLLPYEAEMFQVLYEQQTPAYGFSPFDRVVLAITKSLGERGRLLEESRASFLARVDKTSSRLHSAILRGEYQLPLVQARIIRR